MKKTILSGSLIAMCGIAHAQSSVTLFGAIDAAASWGRGSLASKTALINSGLNASRLGFRGTEDLGGGLAASFWLEAGFNNDTGLGQSTNVNNTTAGTAAANGLTFNRRSTVSLSGPMGEVRIGRDYTPQYVNIGAFDPFNNNGVGAPQTLVGALAAGAPYAVVAGGSSGPLIRASNSVGYFLPAGLGGFYGQAMYFLGEFASGTANSKDGTGSAVRLGYASGPVDVAVGASKTKYLAGDIKTTNLGASYNFGPVKLMGDVVRDAMSGGPTGKGWMVAGVVPVGAGEIHASYSTYDTDVGAEPGARKLAVAYQHNLSKRTALYTTVAHLKNRGGSAQGLNGAITAPNGSSTGLDIGVRHFF